MLNKLVRTGAAFVALTLCAVVPAIGAGGEEKVWQGCAHIEGVDLSQSATSGDLRLAVDVSELVESGSNPYLLAAESDGDYFTAPDDATTGCTTTAPDLLGSWSSPPQLVTYAAEVREFRPNGDVGAALGTGSTQQLTRTAGAPYFGVVTVDINPDVDFCVRVTSSSGSTMHDAAPSGTNPWSCHRVGLRGKRGGGTFPYFI